jgi:hypothetical protein
VLSACVGEMKKFMLTALYGRNNGQRRAWMSDLNHPESSGADQQRRVWRLFNAGRLSEDEATAKLLRLGSGAIVATDHAAALAEQID